MIATAELVVTVWCQSLYDSDGRAGCDCLVSVVKGVISTMHAAASLIITTPPSPQTLGTTAVWTLPERHWYVAGRGTEVLEVGVHEDHGW